MSSVGEERSVSESPRKRRKDSNQRAHHFLHTAKLLDTCNGGQKLLFLEHSWTVARALKVINMVFTCFVLSGLTSTSGQIISPYTLRMPVEGCGVHRSLVIVEFSVLPWSSSLILRTFKMEKTALSLHFWVGLMSQPCCKHL